MTTFIDINQVGRGVQLELAQSSLVETPNTPELITTTGAGTWTKPEGVTKVLVECWGGGGAGGGASVNQTGGDGGAGGQYARKLITYNTAQQSISYSVAASVAGGTGNGATGNDTTWDTNVVIAKGGAGGLANQTDSNRQNPTQGSTAGGVGDVVYAGGSGAAGYYQGSPTNLAVGGGGGGGAGSQGSPSSQQQFNGAEELGGDGGAEDGAATGGINGLSGNLYGGGGSGAAKVSGPNRSGGNGAAGAIRITTYTVTGANPPGVPIEMA